MVGVSILVALAFISTGFAIFLVVRDTVKNIRYEDVYLSDEEEYDVEIFEEEVEDKNCHLTLVSKKGNYEYVYNNEEDYEKPKLEIVSGYSKKRIK